MGLDQPLTQIAGPLVGIVKDGIRANLNMIWQIFANSQELVNRYGLQACEGVDRANQMRTAPLLPRVLPSISSSMISFSARGPEATRTGLGVLGRVRWAIHDKAKFVLLVQTLKDLIDGLNAATPNIIARHKRMVRREIESVDDPKTLELPQRATEYDYPGGSLYIRKLEFDPPNMRLLTTP